MNIRLLYWGRSWENFSRSRRIHFEYHPYCQLEICVRGSVIMHLADKDHVLHAGDMFLVPPGIAHQVMYPDRNEFYSLKFECSNPPAAPVHIENSKFTAWCIASFRQCHSSSARMQLPIDPETREIIEGLLMICMKKFLDTGTERSGEPVLFKKIREAALRTGYCITVSDCAEILEMNTAQLNYQFSKTLKQHDLPHEQYSVKKIIDEALLYLINRYLDFTDFSLEAIASQMKFNNVYTFSRFYKRLSGISPGRRRVRNRE